MIFKKKYKDFHYTGIADLPIIKFWDINKTQDYKLLLKEGKEHPKKFDFKAVWETIFNEYIDQIGLNEKFKEWMALRVRAADYWARSILENNRTFRTLAKVQERRADDVFGEQGNELSTVVAGVSKFMGFRVDPREVTVLEFHQYLKQATNG